MNEAKRIKQLKAWETWGKWAARLLVLAPWLVLVAMGVAYLLGGDTAVETSAAEPYAIVTATPTAVPPVVIENNNYVQVNPPAVDTAVCAIENPLDVGHQQMVVIRGVDREADMRVGWEYMGCDGLPKSAMFCERLANNICFVLIPPVPQGQRLYLTLAGVGYEYKYAVNLADYYWEIDFGGNVTVEEILPTEMWHENDND